MDINVDLVRQLVDQQFPQWRSLPIHPIEPGGWDNRTFRLGTDLTVRLPSHAAYAAQVTKEQRWLPQLAARLPVAIPSPVAEGLPSDAYPWHWSVYRWIDGDTAQVAHIPDRPAFAAELASFLVALHTIDAAGGPLPGPHNFYRGGALEVYDQQTRQAVRELDGHIDGEAVTAVWDAALEAVWNGSSVWVHGDLHPTNLLVRDGQLAAVIDFGCLGVGDPACDLAITWTFFSDASRGTFRQRLAADAGTWIRARGWVMWKALIVMADPDTEAPQREDAWRVFHAVMHECNR